MCAHTHIHIVLEHSFHKIMFAFTTCHIFSVCISLFKNADLGPLNRIHNPLIDCDPVWKTPL